MQRGQTDLNTVKCHHNKVLDKKKTKQDVSRCVAKYPSPPPPVVVPIDNVSQSATVSICPLHFTWLGY